VVRGAGRTGRGRADRGEDRLILEAEAPVIRSWPDHRRRRSAAGGWGARARSPEEACTGAPEGTALARCGACHRPVGVPRQSWSCRIPERDVRPRARPGAAAEPVGRDIWARGAPRGTPLPAEPGRSGLAPPVLQASWACPRARRIGAASRPPQGRRRDRPTRFPQGDAANYRRTIGFLLSVWVTK
jgi:hypothetical protein